MKRYDAIIIGFGKGGKTLAAEYARRGKRVAMIEKSKQMYGGTCINEGCIPSKSLIIQAGQKAYAAAVLQKEALITKLRQKNYDKLNQFENVDIYTAKADFISNHEVHIKNKYMDEIMFGDNIFINTGSKTVYPAISGLRDTHHVYTSATIMKETDLPKKLAIIGGGYIGLEFSSMYARYGSEVTVFENGDRLIKREDADVADEIQRVLKNQGVSFIFESTVTKLENASEQVKLSYINKEGMQEEFIADAVLLAAGRKANTEDLHLEMAGVDVDTRGNIIVNEVLQTTAPNIYAMGDVKGGLQFTYVSLDDYRIIASHLFGDDTRTTNNRGNIAYSMFISPTFSRVGLSEAEAKQQGYEIKVATLPAAAIPRANIINQTDGILKAIIDKKTDCILGTVLFCAQSEELINFVQLAMNADMPYQAIANHIFTHPTMSEALNDLFSAVK